MRSALLLLVVSAVPLVLGEEVSNSVGLRLIRIQPGTFRMGNDQEVPANAGGPPGSPYGDWDERPVHNVSITKAYFLAADEITAELYMQFDPGYKRDPALAPWATGVSWDDATAFCQWLSRKDGHE